MRLSSILGVTSLAMLSALAPTLAGCGAGSTAGSGPADQRQEGQTDFQSAPPANQGGSFGAKGGSASDNGGAATPTAGAAQTGGTAEVQGRTVQETDIYRLDGNFLYYLNSYRGLMVFDVTNVDAPKLVGRSPVFGDPVEMIVSAGTCTLILGDWYGVDDNGDPFYGSVVRTLDARDPSNIKVLGDARVPGWVRDSRAVGHVLYLVSEDEGWEYGWGFGVEDSGGGGVAVGAPSGGDPASGSTSTIAKNRPNAKARFAAMTPNAKRAQKARMSKSRAQVLSGLSGASIMDPSSTSSNGPQTLITSVDLSSIAKPVTVNSVSYPGYQGAFNVTVDTIVLAHDVASDPSQPYSAPSGKSKLEFLDISDPGGKIVTKSSLAVDGSFSGWGTDAGRWNVDYNEDTHIGHVLTCGQSNGGWYCGGDNPTILSTVDYTNPAIPLIRSELSIPSSGWEPAARFDTNRLYLSPSSGYYNQDNLTPVQIYDLTDPTNPALAGSTNITGNIWNFTPNGNTIFALGNDYNNSGGSVSVKYIDVTDPKNPKNLGSAAFGSGWAYTPAADTFKAFLLDSADSLVVLPFSGWSDTSNTYQDGLQLIEFTPTSIQTAGASHTKGWVERGIMVKNRLVSLSDMALSVVDYTDKLNPKTTAELILARNVVDAHPDGTTIAQLSTDWWGNDNTQSELRVLPLADADERLTDSSAISVSIPGTNAQVFRNGDMAYIVSQITAQTTNSSSTTEEIQVVDLSNGGAVLRGKLALPTTVDNFGYDGYEGAYWYDWWDSSDIVQVEGNALAFRRMEYQYDPQTGQETGNQTLYVADLTNADAPQIKGVQVTQENDWWWGNVRAVGNTLYTSHYEWLQNPVYDPNTGNQTQQGIVRYYLDQIDLSDRSNPKVGARINVPGLLVGASDTDSSLLYFIDYRWADQSQFPHDEFSVARLQGNLAYLQSTTSISGWTGDVFVRGNTAYLSAQEYDPNGPWGGTSTVKLHQIDITDPKHPADSSSAAKSGWGWLLDVEGDRAIVTSGWGNGLDLYKLTAGQAPTFDQYARTRGWWSNSIARQDNTIFIASGYWGVQPIQLQ